MKKLFKEHWFKIFFSFCLTAITLFIGYYFVVFLPNEATRKQAAENEEKNNQQALVAKGDLFSKKQGCQKYKSQLQKDIDDKNNSGINSSTVLGEIYYSPAQNTCIYVTTEFTPAHIMTEPLKFITYNAVDVLSGKVLESASVDIEKENGEPRAKKEADFYKYVNSIASE